MEAHIAEVYCIMECLWIVALKNLRYIRIVAARRRHTVA